MLARWRRVQEHGEPEVIAAMESGAVSAKDADEVAKLSRGRQREAAADGAAGLKAAARQSREDRVATRGRATAVPWCREATPGDMDRLARDSRGACGEAADKLFEDEASVGASRPQSAPAAVSGASGPTSLDDAWRNARSEERRRFALEHWQELAGLRLQSVVKANGVKIDKVESLRGLSKLRRDMPRNADVMAVCQSLETALGYVP